VRPKLANRSQLLLGRSSPYCEDMWRRYCCLTSFFPIVDMCLSCEDIARQSCAMVCRRRILGDFRGPAIQASSVQHISDLHSKFALRPHCHTMCRNMVDIQSATAEISREKKVRKKERRLANTLRWFTAGGSIRIAVRQLSQTWKLRHYVIMTRKL